MSDSSHRAAILMIAYSYYESDPQGYPSGRSRRFRGGFDVDFSRLADGRSSPPVEMVRGVRVLRVNYGKYRGRGRLTYILSYLPFFLSFFLKTTALWFKRHYVAIHVNNMPDFLVFSTVIPKLFGTKILLDIHDPMPNFTFASKFKQGNSGILYRKLLLWPGTAQALHIVTRFSPCMNRSSRGSLVKRRWSGRGFNRSNRQLCRRRRVSAPSVIHDRAQGQTGIPRNHRGAFGTPHPDDSLGCVPVTRM